MPELPEVETIRRGLAVHLSDREVRDVEVLHPRAVRRHVGGAVDLSNRLRGKRIAGVERRGKYMWLLASDSTDEVAAVVHLGMSGQMLIAEQGSEDPVHLRIRAVLDDGHELRFVDQRTFGGWHLDDLVDTGARALPESVAHIAADPFEESFDADAVVTALRRRDTEIKRAILDQTVISGVGNIYADESLWRAGLHGRRRTKGITRAALGELVGHITDVMGEAITVGGTSFDDLYVNVNGESGYFDRSLNAYGREGLPCRRCETPMVREAFMNRSSFSCPSCQRAPRTRVNRR
ncbi:bifunctional DNA-formamidopyrimidine glycosylase/DNA-(apurinic or apyrimidinic site) lyase [Gordonia sp. (in: high G+C Gram-positive bacteria)]|uniref:bifunctional DNA-formamidopyrimidine glycosylase/DNA-(apurinic or apyrimidinic site) lyase n=1 Tax=Gordonia sp. (in: high G+C Gram-positive bacteria) TaxID=84139 RepID=UPI001699EF48|nr:bifunctional DNA-formamidopyrimidine glycosylase/DNA-(apurinic or apyrimidinic site) lyase [Gordonia sp. (in: high G+C Gram-positive bacteria)]NLG47871.1 bifunctional DNA-formamidopyrimidine glycosylase/DNA-(apurinic or apyrimidinic site) lyase [Gordonia sp. (in: high G+C Gram-positive bacteria)]